MTAIVTMTLVNGVRASGEDAVECACVCVCVCVCIIAPVTMV